MNKKIILIGFCTMSFLLTNAMVSKTINVTTAGTLGTLLTATEKTNVTDLIVTGNIDTRDIKCMRDELIALINLDMGNAVIVAFTGTGGTILSTAASTVYNTNELPYAAFCDNKTINTIILPKSLRSLADWSLENTNISTLNIPSLVTKIGREVFYGCNNLTTIAIPPLVSSIGKYAFFCNASAQVDAANLNYSSFDGALFNKSQSKILQIPTSKTSFTIPSTVDSIGEATAFGNVKLTSITIPNSVKYIGLDAFRECSGLTTVTIPNSVVSIDGEAFALCTGLTDIVISDAIDAINYNTFYGCSKLSHINTPKNLKFIGLAAFYCCGSLTTFTIPNTLEMIDTRGFQECKKLKISYENSPIIQSIGDYAFRHCDAMTDVQIPASITFLGEQAFGECKILNNINVDNNNATYTSENGVLFSKDKTILVAYPTSRAGSYSIPSSVITVGCLAFDSCANLTSVAIPNSVLNIETNAFWYCTSMTSLSIPKSMSSIGNYAFFGCSGLSSIYVNQTNPLDMSSAPNAFRYVNKSSCILHVPSGAKANYTNALVWSDFINIKEDITSTNDNYINKTKVYAAASTIIVEGIKQGEEIRLYTANGAQLQILKSEGDKITLPVTKGKIYFIKTADKNYKISL